jgi:hypothetical protein
MLIPAYSSWEHSSKMSMLLDSLDIAKSKKLQQKPFEV